jgi:hypothetical protein
MRRVNLLSIVILTAWLLSPLGGQSSLRLLSTQPAIEIVNATVQYQSLKGFESHSMLSSYMLDKWSSYVPIYMTALQTSRLNVDKPWDLFGNVRIPDIGSLIPSNEKDPATFEWHTLGDQTIPAWTSLLGVPVADVPKSGNISFTLESPYWEIRCTPFVTREYLARYEGNLTNNPFAHDEEKSFLWEPAFTLELEGEKRRPTIENDFSVLTTYTTRSFDRYIHRSNCTLRLRLAESVINCEDAACNVKKMRYLYRDFTDFFGGLYLQYLLYHMSRVEMGLTGISSQLVEFWMADPRSYLGGRSSERMASD